MYSAGTPAHVQSIYGQLVTSSSLKWIRSGTGVPLPDSAVHSGTNSGVVCRGRHHGTNVVGATGGLGGAFCKAGFANRLVPLRNFEVLTQVPGAVKLIWKNFTRFSVPVHGCVAGVDGDNQPIYIARRLEASGDLVPAVVEIPVASYGTGLIKVYTDHSVEDVEEGEVLVEVEPVRYRLHLHRFDQSPKESQKRQTLASSSIFRFLEGKKTTARMQKMLSYTYVASEYYSHVAGTVKGLPVEIKLPSGEVKSRLWGMRDTRKQTESIMVGFDMQQNSAVDVRVVCDSIKLEQPFSGTLVAVFPDGSERTRQVEGSMVLESLQNIRPEYSKLYQIKEKVMISQARNFPTELDQVFIIVIYILPKYNF